MNIRSIVVTVCTMLFLCFVSYHAGAPNVPYRPVPVAAPVAAPIVPFLEAGVLDYEQCVVPLRCDDDADAGGPRC